MKINLGKLMALAVGFIVTASVQNTFAAQFKVVGFETSWDDGASPLIANRATPSLWRIYTSSSGS